MKQGRKDAIAEIKENSVFYSDRPIEDIYLDAYYKGAREFADRLRVNFDLLAWNNSDEVIDYTLAEWKKGEE